MNKQTLVTDPRHVRNLIKLGLWLLDNKEAITPTFDMRYYACAKNIKGIIPFTSPVDLRQYEEMLVPNVTLDYAVFHCAAGLATKPEVGMELPAAMSVEEFEAYNYRSSCHLLFGTGQGHEANGAQLFLFSSWHARDVEATAKRIFWFLQFGAPVTDKVQQAEVHILPDDLYSEYQKQCITLVAESRKDKKCLAAVERTSLHEVAGVELDYEGAWHVDIPAWRAELARMQQETIAA